MASVRSVSPRSATTPTPTPTSPPRCAATGYSSPPPATRTAGGCPRGRCSIRRPTGTWSLSRVIRPGTAVDTEGAALWEGAGGKSARRRTVEDSGCHRALVRSPDEPEQQGHVGLQDRRIRAVMSQRCYRLRIVGLTEDEGQIKVTTIQRVLDALLKTRGTHGSSARYRFREGEGWQAPVACRHHGHDHCRSVGRINRR